MLVLFMESNKGKTSFLVLVALSIVLWEVLFFALIFFINPYSFYDRTSSLHNKPLVLNAAVMNNKNPGLLMHKLEKNIGNFNGRDVLIGSSRVFTGFALCNNGSVLKVSKLGVTSGEIKFLVDTAFHNMANRRIYVELRGVGSVYSQPEKPSLFDFTLGFDSLSVSLISIYNLYFDNDNKRMPGCYDGYGWKKVPPGEASEYQRKHLTYSQLFESQGRQDLLNFMSTVSQSCASGSGQDIVFFIAPIYKTLVDYQKVKQGVAKLKKQLTQINSHCDSVSLVSYSDFDDFAPNQSNWVYKGDNWYDINHFKPNLGDVFLERLFETEAQSSRD